MMQWLNQFSVETLIAAPVIVIGSVILIITEVHSWIKKGHSALF